MWSWLKLVIEHSLKRFESSHCHSLGFSKLGRTRPFKVIFFHWFQDNPRELRWYSGHNQTQSYSGISYKQNHTPIINHPHIYPRTIGSTSYQLSTSIGGKTAAETCPWVGGAVGLLAENPLHFALQMGENPPRCSWAKCGIWWATTNTIRFWDILASSVFARCDPASGFAFIGRTIANREIPSSTAFWCTMGQGCNLVKDIAGLGTWHLHEHRTCTWYAGDMHQVWVMSFGVPRKKHQIMTDSPFFPKRIP